MIQKRTITVNSGQPGELEVVMDRRHAEDAPPEPSERDDLQDHRMRSPSRRGRRGSRAAAGCSWRSRARRTSPPIASEPVSPMKIWPARRSTTGSPRAPPSCRRRRWRCRASRVRSRRSSRRRDDPPPKHGWRNCQNAMNTYAAQTRVLEPAASPSSPSVRFTACDDAVSTKNTQTRKNTPSASAVGRMKERLVEMPVSSDERDTITPNDDRDDRRAGELLELREPERAAIAHLHEVVEEPDEPEARARRAPRRGRPP